MRHLTRAYATPLFVERAQRTCGRTRRLPRYFAKTFSVAALALIWKGSCLNGIQSAKMALSTRHASISWLDTLARRRQSASMLRCGAHSQRASTGHRDNVRRPSVSAWRQERAKQTSIAATAQAWHH